MEWLRKLLGQEPPPTTRPLPPEQRPLPEQPPLPEIDLATAPSQGFAQPHFRYLPGAYDFGENGEDIFKRSTGPCHCCGMRDIFAYQGSVYWPRRDKPVICAQCIADARLDELLSEGEGYALHDTQLEGLKWTDPINDEIAVRTPGFATYNPFQWAVLDGEPMAFIGYGDDKALGAIPAARAAISEAWKALDADDAFPTPYMLIFKEVGGERYRAILDID